jgi:hypothetical protein
LIFAGALAEMSVIPESYSMKDMSILNEIYLSSLIPVVVIRISPILQCMGYDLRPLSHVLFTSIQLSLSAYIAFLSTILISSKKTRQDLAIIFSFRFLQGWDYSN